MAEAIHRQAKELAIKKEEFRTKGGMDMCTVLRELKEEGRMDDLVRASRDAQYQNELMVECGIKG